ncbi:MAG: head-tail adaptor protein [Comamonadaceae bacterium]|nr:MAG: head-tail adaptor protein [Comamonadaceae bacterium]
MRAGALNRRLAIWRPEEGSDDGAQPVQIWVDVATVWADVRFLNGTESLRADAVSAVSKASIRIRYRTDVSTSMRAFMGGTEFRIVAVLPDEQRRQHVDLVCEVMA